MGGARVAFARLMAAAGRGGGPVRAALLTALVIDLAVLGADLYLLDGVSSTTRVDLDEALVDFREEASGAAPVELPPAAAASDPAGATDAVAGPSAPAPVPEASAPATSAAGTGAGSTVPDTGPPAPAPSFRPPAEGVYHYRTAGGETISVLGARHEYPADTYTVVRHIGGCEWTARAEVVREHVDSRRMCSEPGRLLQHEQGREVEFFNTRDGGTYACAPAQVQHVVGDAPGATSVTDCTDGAGSTARLSRRTLGADQMTVGGVAVDVVRLRIDGQMEGRVRGTSVDLLTIDAATGLPVVWERSLDTTADAFGTTVRYREQVRFDLVSLTPAT